VLKRCSEKFLGVVAFGVGTRLAGKLPTPCRFLTFKHRYAKRAEISPGAMR
jgi:hypothetical protein